MMKNLYYKKSFQKYLKLFVVSTAILFIFICFGNFIPIDWKYKYGITGVFFIGSLIIVLFQAHKTNSFLKKGKRYEARIIHSSYDEMPDVPRVYYYKKTGYLFPRKMSDDVICVQCVIDSLEENKELCFKDYFINPLVKRMNSDIYKQEVPFSQIDNVFVIVNPKNYKQYEIMYCELIKDKYLKDFSNLLITIFILFVPIFVYIRYLLNYIY